MVMDMKKHWKMVLGSIGILILFIVIDFVCIFTINKPLFAIREDNGDSVNLKYKGLLYDTYICHDNGTKIMFKGKKFNCGYVIENKETTYIISQIDNVSTDIFDISLTGATMKIKDTNIKPYVYGEWYKIEKEIDGKWYEMDTIDDNFGFNEMGYIPNEDNDVTFIMNWEELYGELPLGSYRIIKRVGDKYLATEFGIGLTS